MKKIIFLFLVQSMLLFSQDNEFISYKYCLDAVATANEKTGCILRSFEDSLFEKIKKNDEYLSPGKSNTIIYFYNFQLDESGNVRLLEFKSKEKKPAERALINMYRNVQATIFTDLDEKPMSISFSGAFRVSRIRGELIMTVSSTEEFEKNTKYKVPDLDKATFPVHPYCKGIKSEKALRDCFNKKIANEIKYSVTLEENLQKIDLPVGQYTVLTKFIINKEGKADNIKVSLRGKHVKHVLSTTKVKLEVMVRKVLLGLPTMESGKLDKKPIDTPLIFPITFKIQ